VRREWPIPVAVTGNTYQEKIRSMLLHNTTRNWDARLHTARRIFSLLPIVVFLLTLILLASSVEPSFAAFLSALLQSIATSLASSFVSIAAYGFYRYLLDRSLGL
jgi:hypothetical protein